MMAYFGWPEGHENDAERAARAGLAILKSISRLNDKPTHSQLAARVGIHSGAVVVGAGVGKEADAFGDVLSIAARVQAIAEPGTVLITADTQHLIARTFKVEERGAHRLKGIEQLVQVCEVKVQLSRVKQLYTYVADLFSDLVTDFNTNTTLQKVNYIVGVCTIIGLLFGIPSRVYRYVFGPDPLVRLNNAGFSFDTVSYFRAIKTGRRDIVLSFLKLGMSPYTLEENNANQRHRTALSVAIASNIPDICPMIDVFAKHGMDITSQRANGSPYNATLMDEALGDYNEDAVRCLAKYFIHLQIYQTYLAHRTTVIRTLIGSPKDTAMGRVFPDCESAILHIFGRPEAFEGENVTSHRYQDVAERICFSGLFTVSSFQQEYHLDLQSMLDGDQKMLVALAP